MEYKAIKVDKNDGVCTITLNRPDRLNALNQQMIEELIKVLEDAGADDGIRVVVLTGAGKSFCAGGDFGFDKVKEGKVDISDAEDVGDVAGSMRRGHLFHYIIKGVILPIHRMEKPTIAVINGPAVAGGLDIALACDMRIGSENARFGVGFTKIGLCIGTGGAWFLPRIIGLNRALEFVMSGDIMDADEAYRVGLLNKLFPTDTLEEKADQFARRLASGAPIALRLAKMQIYKGLETDLETALAFGSACEFVTISSDDHREGVMAFAQKRAPNYEGK